MRWPERAPIRRCDDGRSARHNNGFPRHTAATLNHVSAVFSADFAGSNHALWWSGESAMNDDLIYIEPRQEAVLRYDDESVTCRNVPEAWLAWAQLEIDQKA